MGFPAPVFFAWMAALSELVGGVFLAIGFATRPAAFLIACTMTTAGFVRHAADPYGRKELAFLYLAVAVMFMLTGAGRYSVDGTVLKKWSR
jgi:putative oxidoreductase